MILNNELLLRNPVKLHPVPLVTLKSRYNIVGSTADVVLWLILVAFVSLKLQLIADVTPAGAALQKEFRDSISSYKKDIKKIDENITNIKTQRNVTNNYYDKKIDELKMLDAKKVDSLLRKRYNY